MLHMINRSPLGSPSLESALRVAAKGAPLLLLEDGVYAARPGTRAEGLVKTALAAHPVYALQPDLKARGIERVIEGISVIGYDGFVELVEEHSPVPWL
jgi:tRNA 2-thiouridine synthesizing protein B